MVTPRVDPSQRIAPAFSPNDTLSSARRMYSESEQTVVRPKATALYSVEIWRSGVREAVVPITKNEITIGRGSRSISVDLPIKGDPEVSRVHAVLVADNEGRYWLVAKGRNPTLVNGKEFSREEPTEVAPDQKIAICNFVIRIQPIVTKGAKKHKAHGFLKKTFCAFCASLRKLLFRGRRSDP
jgi:hypothetical protein